jgi:hypothetical protein
MRMSRGLYRVEFLVWPFLYFYVEKFMSISVRDAQTFSTSCMVIVESWW